MELIRGTYNIKAEHQGCVATIGNFDGVHLGHQMILKTMQVEASKRNCKTLVMFFEPQPLEYFATIRDVAPPPRLSNLRDKILLLKEQKLDLALCLRFNEALANMEAHDFIQHILVDKLKIKWLIIGDDFRFGRGRQGDFHLLKKTGIEFGFDVVHMPTILQEEERVSSSLIRQALAEDDLAKAKKLLGKPYKMAGRVVRGDELGRALGVPTANIKPYRDVMPMTGVFVVQVLGLRKNPMPAVASIGSRPTVEGHAMLLEIHIFDFAENIYGRALQIEFHKKLRDQVKYDSLDELKTQMQKDIAECKTFFA